MAPVFSLGLWPARLPRSWEAGARLKAQTQGSLERLNSTTAMENICWACSLGKGG